MHQKIIIFLCCSLLICSSCGRPEQDFRNKFRWISGHWVGKVGENEVRESWTWKKHRFEGVGFTIENGDDTISMESLFLDSYAGQIAYIAVVDDRGPFLFTLSRMQENLVVFENSEHDFPSVISYEKRGDSAITISLYSKNEKAVPAMKYNLKRDTK